MATARQIEANRRNAERSTGPQTAAGKSISSSNALRHGLSLPLVMDAKTTADIEELAHLLVDEEPHYMAAALEAAAAQIDLLRIQKTRRSTLAKIDLANATEQELQHLLAIDRYETRARTRRRRACSRMIIKQNTPKEKKKERCVKLTHLSLRELRRTSDADPGVSQSAGRRYSERSVD